MNYKIPVIIGIVAILLLTFVVAEDLIGEEKFSITYDTTPTLFMSDNIKEDFNSEYGAITLESSKTGKVSEYTITSIAEGPIDIIMYGRATLYLDGTLFDGTNYTGDATGSYSILVSKDNFVDVVDTEKEICNINLTSGKNSCYIDYTYIKVNQPYLVWEIYNGKDILKLGDYSWKFEGKRVVGEIVDIVPTKEGIPFSQWTWFNTTWQYKQAITITNNSAEGLKNFTLYVKVNLTTPMAAGKVATNCGDIRFVNASESGEVPFRILTCTTGTESVFEFRIDDTVPNGIVTHYMYYGNTSYVASTQNANNTYLFYDDSMASSLTKYTLVGACASKALAWSGNEYNFSCSAGGSGIGGAMPKTGNVSNVTISANIKDFTTAYSSLIFVRIQNNTDNSFSHQKVNAAIYMRRFNAGSAVEKGTIGAGLVQRKYYLRTLNSLGQNISGTTQNATYYVGGSFLDNTAYLDGQTAVGLYYDGLKVSFNNVTVRKWLGIATGPTYSFGAEETNTPEPSECWTETQNVIYIPNGCLYQLNNGGLS